MSALSRRKLFGLALGGAAASVLRLPATATAQQQPLVRTTLSNGLTVIAVRIGWVRPGVNRASEIPPERGPWFRLMWLSNRDFCQLMTRCIQADPAIRFAVINGMSANTGMRWDIESTRRLLGYHPQDDVTRPGA